MGNFYFNKLRPWWQIFSNSSIYSARSDIRTTLVTGKNSTKCTFLNKAGWKKCHHGNPQINHVNSVFFSYALCYFSLEGWDAGFKVLIQNWPSWLDVFLLSDFIEEISANPVALRAKTPKAFHQHGITENAKMIYV